MLTPAFCRITGCAFVALVIALVAAACGSKPPTGPSDPTIRITSISPSTGSTTGGTAVTITGSGFASDAVVIIGGVTATSVTVQGTTSIAAVVAPHTGAGPSDVVVTAGGLTATLRGGYTFIAPSSQNQAPVVTAIRSIGSRANQPSGFADVDETVTLVATVADAETAAGSLSYAWSGPGTFTGTGSTVTWRLPSTVSPTPSAMDATLIVTETFVEGGISHVNRSTQAFTMQVHDSQKEILDLGEDFLTLFSKSEVPPDDVLHNFSPTCDGGSGRQNEKGDVEANRNKYLQDFSKFRIARIPPVSFNFAGSCFAFGDPTRRRRADACSLFTVHWEVTYIRAVDGHRVGEREITDGTDHVTAVLENNQWRLCHSDFSGSTVNTITGIRRQVSW